MTSASVKSNSDSDTQCVVCRLAVYTLQSLEEECPLLKQGLTKMLIKTTLGRHKNKSLCVVVAKC